MLLRAAGVEGVEKLRSCGMQRRDVLGTELIRNAR